MAQVTNKYQSPSGICWDLDGDIGSGGWYSTKANVSATKTTLYLTWQSTCYTFQAQWRRRRRYSPASAAAISLSGATLWEDWGEWEGSNLSEDLAIDVTIPYGQMRYLTAPFEVPYDFSEYDLWEYQVRVRVIDEPSLLCSEWSYETLKVAFLPQWSYGSATRNADGSVTVEILHNMTRPCTFRMGDLKVGDTVKNTKTIGRMNEKVTIPAGGGTINIPASIIGSYKKVKTPSAELTSYDNASRGGAGSYFTVDQASDDEGITAPVVTFEDSDLSTRVAVEDAGYDNVFVTAEWNDAAYGDRHFEPLEVSEGWEAEFVAPPYNTEIVYHVTVVRGGSWRTSTFVRTLDRKFRHMSFVNEYGESVILRYKTMRKVTASVEGEAVKCAGRKNPVARYGIGGVMKIAAEGKILDPMYSAGGAWLPEVEKLRSNEPWVYRDPEGRRMRVMVKTVTTSSQTASGPRGVVDVSISMTEVE